MRKNCKIVGDNMNVSYFKNLVEQKLLSLSTVYLARVLNHEANADSCNIQPLSLIKAVGGEAKKQAVIQNVPISQSVLGALGDGKTLKGVVAIVACCERDSNQTRKNEYALPSFRHHSKSDSIVIGCLTENTGGGSGNSNQEVIDARKATFTDKAFSSLSQRLQYDFNTRIGQDELEQAMSELLIQARIEWKTDIDETLGIIESSLSEVVDLSESTEVTE